MEFLTLENFFVHDNFNIVQDKNIFLGRWTRQKWDNLELSRIWAWNLWGHLKIKKFDQGRRTWSGLISIQKNLTTNSCRCLLICTQMMNEIGSEIMPLWSALLQSPSNAYKRLASLKK